MKSRTILLIGLLLSLVFAGATLAQARGEDTIAVVTSSGLYQVTWANTGAGVTRLAGSSYTLTGSAAPIDAGSATTSANYRLRPNYVSVGNTVGASRTYLPLVLR